MRDRRQTFWIHDAPPGACMPSIQYTEVWRQLDMSQKKSPPPKQEKIFTTVKTPQADGKSLKRKLITPGSPGEEDDKRTDRTPKRKRASIGLESSPLAGAASQNKTPTNPQRLGTHNVPLSERQQLAMIIRMTDENSQDSSPKHQSSTPPQITPGKRTPGDKKVHKRNERGETQLHITAKKGDIKHTKKLIKAGADVNVRDFAGWTALHEACNHGCLDVAKQLLKAGANVNVQGLDKDTPLHDASICGHQKLVELLLKHGANPLQANSKGKTAVDVACSPEIATLLRKEILSSSSDSSSMDDIRSPTSPESTCDDRQGREDDRQVDIDAFALRISTQISSGCVTSPTVSRSNNMGIPVSGMGGIVTSEVQEEMPFAGSHYSSHFGDLSAVALAKRAVPKSPEGKTNSPRLCLKFRPNDGVNSESSDLSKDWRRPQYKSYSVTLETGERKGSPANSASSSNSSDLYDPQIDSGARLKFAENVLHSRNNGDGLISSSNSIACQPADSFSRFDMNSSDRGPGGSAGSAPSKPPLVSIQTGPFSPQFEDISDSEQEESQLPLHSDQSANKASVSLSHVTSQFSRIPVIRSSVIGEPLSKDEEIDSDNGLFPPRNRSSSCVTSSKDHIRQNAVDGRERTRHNSAPDKKNISEHDSVSLKALEVSVSDSSHVDHWDSITSSGIPSITQAEQPSCRPHETLHRTASENSALSPSSKDDSKLPRTFSQPDPSSQPGKPFFKMDIKYSPKVPPLKIILPTKTTATAGQVDRAGSPSVSALPYVVNAASTGEGEPAAGSVSQDTSQASSTASSRPSSRASSPSDSHDKVDIGKIVDRLTSQAEEEDAQAAKELENQSKTETNEVKPTEKDDEDKTKTKETKVEKEEKTTMVLRDRDKGKEQTDSNKEKEKDKDKDTKEPSLTEKESDKDQKESKEQKEERRTTRTLRSHTQMLLQQQQQQQQQAQQKNTETQDTKTGSSQNDGSHEENSTNQPKAEEQPDEGLTNRKRKLRPKPETSGSDSQPLPPIQYEKPPNPYELFRSIRSQVAMRRNNLVIVAPKPPQGYKDFKIVNCSYVLHGNQASRLAVPMLTPPNSVTGPIRDLFMEQEKARYKLRLQHIVEREKLMMTVEQEVLRLHGRAARATINQSLPLGVCTVLKDEEIYNIFEMEERDKNVRTRYNGRQFLSWYHDVVDKFDKIKSYLLLRHHHEAESLFAVQKMDWEWKLKELGLCDSNTTPVIDELHVPMVQVNEEFELLPA